MPPRLITEGKIQVLGETIHSVVYAVAGDSETGLAKDSLSVLKGGSVWYEGRQALGPGKKIGESDERLRKEAAMYKALGKHERILELLGLEESVLVGRDEPPGTVPQAWALRLERASFGSLREPACGADTAGSGDPVCRGGCACAPLWDRMGGPVDPQRPPL